MFSDRSFSAPRRSLCQYGVLTFLAGLQLAGCTRHEQVDDQEEGSVAPAAVVAVRTVAITRGDIDITLTVTGRTEVLRKERIVAPVAGTVVALKAIEGTEVERGTVLALLQPRETYAAIAGAEALQRAAGTPFEHEEAAGALALARAHQNTVEIRAASRGVIASRAVAEGEALPEGAELMTLVDLSTVAFIADVQLSDIGSLRPGQPAVVELQGLPEAQCPAVVDAVYPRAEPETQSAKVRLRFRNTPGRMRAVIRPETNGLAHITTGVRRGVFMVPDSALLRNDETNHYTVVVATQDSIARVVPVEVGAHAGAAMEVRSPALAPGMRVIVSGNYALADSARIIPVH